MFDVDDGRNPSERAVERCGHVMANPKRYSVRNEQVANRRQDAVGFQQMIQHLKTADERKAGRRVEACLEQPLREMWPNRSRRLGDGVTTRLHARDAIEVGFTRRRLQKPSRSRSNLQQPLQVW